MKKRLKSIGSMLAVFIGTIVVIGLSVGLPAVLADERQTPEVTKVTIPFVSKEHYERVGVEGKGTVTWLDEAGNENKNDYTIENRWGEIQLTFHSNELGKQMNEAVQEEAYEAFKDHFGSSRTILWMNRWHEVHN